MGPALSGRYRADGLVCPGESDSGNRHVTYTGVTFSSVYLLHTGKQHFLWSAVYLCACSPFLMEQMKTTLKDMFCLHLGLDSSWMGDLEGMQSCEDPSDRLCSIGLLTVLLLCHTAELLIIYNH